MTHTTDETVLKKIETLVHEEQRLYSHGSLSKEDQAKLNDLKVQLDQAWDLLRQRRALREFGEDPNHAALRPKSVVEGYEQ